MADRSSRISGADQVEVEVTIRIGRAAISQLARFVQPAIEQAVRDAFAGRLPAAERSDGNQTAISATPQSGPSITILSEPLLLNMKQVAKLLGISERTVWGRSNSGEMPRARKIGSSPRWSLDELKAWIAAGCPKPTDGTGIAT